MTAMAEGGNRVYRSAWDGFPDVIVQTTIAKLRSHNAYAAAKRGDEEAALELARATVKMEKIAFDFDAVVPVAQFDRGWPNALPFAYATQIARHFDVDLSLGIVQRNVVLHTGADAATRSLGQPIFMGELEVGNQILIVDDVVTYGSTLANLRGWIEKKGATVVGATTLAAAFGATKLALPVLVYERLVGKFPVQAEKLANELGFTARCFTNREARFLCGLKRVQDIEDLVQTALEMKQSRERGDSYERDID
jgi:adenine/guanine phosphoribosyltransferase-like PRPP-binding protein